ncbi:hypothetical protein CGZ80_06515 [Rhodopirellula sp. MGV]|nr:hypothetical protein CGZ80_06515 [Rhodopirellula sp. MGV]
MKGEIPNRTVAPLARVTVQTGIIRLLNEIFQRENSSSVGRNLTHSNFFAPRLDLKASAWNVFSLSELCTKKFGNADHRGAELVSIAVQFFHRT